MRTSELRRNRRRGATLIELLVSTGVYSFVAIALFALMRDGTRNWQAVEARSMVQSQLRTFERDISDELQKGQLSSIRIYGYGGSYYFAGAKVTEAYQDGYQHAIVFRSAMNDKDDPASLGDPLIFQMGTEIPVPLIHWQRYVLYYISRPSDNQHVADYGYLCGTASNPDNVCPHKWLIRKDIMLSAGITSAADLIDPSKNDGMTSFIESGGPQFPDLYQLPKGKVARAKILARNLLSFNLGVVNAAGTAVGLNSDGSLKTSGSVILFDVKAVKLMEAASMISVGNRDLSASQYTVQLDNAVAPVN